MSNQRMFKLYAAFGDGGEFTQPMLAERGQMTLDAARKTIYNAQFLDNVVRVERKEGKHSVYRLTEQGKERAARYRHGDAASEQPLECALAAIKAAHLGLTDEDLAELLDKRRQTVNELLAEQVSSHRLVTCVVQRFIDGAPVQLTLYRTSVGGSSTLADARVGGQATAPESAAHAGADEAASAALSLPVFECDIGTMHRNVQPAAAISDDATATDPEDVGFMAALYSNDVLWLQLDGGQQVSLSADETRKLFQYLDRLGGTNLEGALQCA